MSPTTPRSEHVYGTRLVLAGVLVLSFEALLIRWAGTDGWNIVFWRSLLMIVSLTTLLAVRGRLVGALATGRRRGLILTAGLVGVNTVLFVQAISHTAVANAVVILASAPLFAAIFSALFLRERVPLRTWLAVVGVLAGLAGVFAGSMRGDGVLGDVLALAAAANFGAAMTALRRFPKLDPVTVNLFGALVAVLVSLPFAQPLALPPQSYVVLAVMGLAQMPVAMVCLATGPRYLPAAEVSLLLLLETMLGPLWVWLALSEQPPAATVAAGLFILGVLGAHSWIGLRKAAAVGGPRLHP